MLFSALSKFHRLVSLMHGDVHCSVELNALMGTKARRNTRELRQRNISSICLKLHVTEAGCRRTDVDFIPTNVAPSTGIAILFRNGSDPHRRLCTGLTLPLRGSGSHSRKACLFLCQEVARCWILPRSHVRFVLPASKDSPHFGVTQSRAVTLRALRATGAGFVHPRRLKICSDSP